MNNESEKDKEQNKSKYVKIYLDRKEMKLEEINILIRELKKKRERIERKSKD